MNIPRKWSNVMKNEVVTWGGGVAGWKNGGWGGVLTVLDSILKPFQKAKEIR